SSWWVLPVKTLDVVRKRCADVLASLTDCLVALRRDPSALADSLSRFDADLAQLEQVAPALRAHRRLPDRLHGGRPLAGAIDALHHCAGPLRAIAVDGGHHADEAAASLTPLAHPRIVGLYAAVMANVAAVRRAIGRQPDALYRPPPSTTAPVNDLPLDAEAFELSKVRVALLEIDTSMASLFAIFSTPPSQPSAASPPQA
ncbi:MAG: hypothetical protein JWP52_1698, partial [Rhizobacter sp.]|nr:hypothetical protein [Rhizobacter sp.]